MSRRRYGIPAAVLVLLIVLLLWLGRTPSATFEVSERALVSSVGTLPPSADPEESEAPEADPLERSALRIWLHDPRWVWWSRRVPVERYSELELPSDWEEEVEDSATWQSLRQRTSPWEQLEASMRTDDLHGRDLEHPAWAAMALLARLQVERATWHRRWQDAIAEVLPPGETWSSIGTKQRQAHYQEGRVPRGLDEEALREDVRLFEELWPDEPFLGDLGTMVEVALVLEGGGSRATRSDEERELMAVELLETIEDPSLGVVAAEIIADRVVRPTSMDAVERVMDRLPEGTYRRAHMQMWAVDAAVRRKDVPRMDRWSRELMGDLELPCAEMADVQAEHACPRYGTAYDSVQARVAAFGKGATSTWQQALIATGWRCAMELGGVRVLTRGTTTVEARWDGVAWHWGPWPDDPGIGACLREAHPEPTPTKPLVVDVTVEVGR